LPYLKDRPQSLNRHPNGIAGESFFQKDMGDTAPEWAATIKISEAGKEINYLLCQDTDTLIYMANLGCIEINVWNSVAGTLDKPDYVALDFDPVAVPFSRVVEAVLTTKKILDEIELRLFARPLDLKECISIFRSNRLQLRTALNFAHLINVIVKKRLPDLVSLERMPGKRKDWFILIICKTATARPWQRHIR